MRKIRLVLQRQHKTLALVRSSHSQIHFLEIANSDRMAKTAFTAWGQISKAALVV